MQLGKYLFKGKSFHTAQWPKDYHVEGRNVAIIGTGASAVQMIPAIADKVKKLTVFQRTPGWVPHRANFIFPAWMKVWDWTYKCFHNSILLSQIHFSGSLLFSHLQWQWSATLSTWCMKPSFLSYFARAPGGSRPWSMTLFWRIMMLSKTLRSGENWSQHMRVAVKGSHHMHAMQRWFNAMRSSIGQIYNLISCICRPTTKPMWLW